MLCHEENREKGRGWAVTLLYPTMLLFTIINFQTSIFSRELDEGASSLSSSMTASHNMTTLTVTNCNKEPGPAEESQIQQKLDIETKRLLSHVLVMITYWYNPNEKEIKFLGHTLGTVKDWHLHPEVGNVTVVIVTNDAEATNTAIGGMNDDWYVIYQVDYHDNPYHMPYYHREVIADYIDKTKDATNMTDMLNKDLEPPTAYAYFETDNVLDGVGLLAWAQDTAYLQHHGETNHIRHFWRWEWNTMKQCAAFTGQVKSISRNSSTLKIGDREFASMTGGGVWAGMYVLTAEHMKRFYFDSGAFWTLPTSQKIPREEQLHYIVHGNDQMAKPGKKEGDNTIVPIDEQTRTVHLVAGVHHQSDKYQKKKWPLSKLCINDLFI